MASLLLNSFFRPYFLPIIADGNIIIFHPKNANSLLSSYNNSFHQPLTFSFYLHQIKRKEENNQPQNEIKTTHFHTSLFILIFMMYFWCFMVLHLHLIFFSHHRTSAQTTIFRIIIALWVATYHSFYKVRFIRIANKRYVFAINKDLRHRHTVVTTFAF